MVDTEDFSTWNSTEPPEYNHANEGDIGLQETVFPVSTEINSQLTIWDGDISTLKVHAIVNLLNETGPIQKAALLTKMAPVGPDSNWIESLSEIKLCRTGEARITPGFRLPCRYVIHTVSPRYNSRYQSAAENALYNCYRNSLMMLVENKLKTIAIPPLHSVLLNYPIEPGAHIALRTIRRILEKCTASFSRIYLYIPDPYKAIYMSLLPLYFPRNHDEEMHSRRSLPLDVGNEFGEPVRADRVIRIASNPIRRIGQDPLSASDDDEEEIMEEAPEQGAVTESDGDYRENPGLHAFAQMEQDPDTRHRVRQAVQMSNITSLEDALSAQRRYERWLRQSHQTNLASISNLHCIYHSGSDHQGHPVIVVVGKYFPAATIDFQLAAMYFIQLMDKIVNESYSVVYLHTNTSKENQPPLAFIRDVYSITDARYKRNLKALFIVHSGLWARVLTWFFTTFSAVDIKSKVHRLPCLAQLFQYIDPGQLDLPDFCYQYDKKVSNESFSRRSSSADHNAL